MRAMLSVLAYDVSEKDPDYARIEQDLDVRYVYVYVYVRALEYSRYVLSSLVLYRGVVYCIQVYTNLSHVRTT
jgi:hypothetical protein